MITKKKTANAMGGKTARACDSCLRRRARWFCAADDAFLCQACDASVHSANQLASKHERVRLQTWSFKGKESMVLGDDEASPAWHRGFTRKARTPRHNKAVTLVQHTKEDEQKVLELDPPMAFVPEMSNEDASLNGNGDEDLLYRVPIFDPFAAETIIENDDHHNLMVDDYGKNDASEELDNLHGFLPSEIELAEFAADVENLLGGGLDDIKEFGLELLECKGEDNNEACISVEEAKMVKVEEDETVLGAIAFQLDPCFGENFDFELSDGTIAGEEKVVPTMEERKIANSNEQKKREILLRLNYEAVIAAWASQGSPWTTGTRPEVNPDHGWPDHMDTEIHLPYGEVGVHGGQAGSSHDVGREARVSRYREKRRTRLFSKKIRYEVRKLNAEKRPRMKGRFVKRTSFMGNTSSTSFPYLDK
ncbi:hypothetical protein UlMin_008554 [Ulmus minor]